MFVYGHIEWGSHVRIRVYLHVTGGLHEGAPFVVAGKAVGRIETIALVPKGAPGPLAGDQGVVAIVALDAKRAPELQKGGDIFVASRGALSDKYLELGPAPGPGPGFADGDELLGRDPPTLDRVIQRTWDNLQSLAAFTDGLRPELEALRAQVALLRTHLDPNAPDPLPGIAQLAPLALDARTIADQIAQLRDVGLGGEAGRAKLAATIALGRTVLEAGRADVGRLGTSLTALSASVDALRARLGTKGDQAIASLQAAIDRTREAIAKLDPLLAQIDALDAAIARGDGSIGKLMKDPEFPEDAKELGKILKRQPWRIIGHPQDH